MQKINQILARAGLETFEKQRDDLILPSTDENTYTVYGEDWCGFTSAARNLLRQHGKTYIYVSFRENRPLRNKFSLQHASGHKTIPLVFKGQKFIGGFEQLKNDFK